MQATIRAHNVTSSLSILAGWRGKTFLSLHDVLEGAARRAGRQPGGTPLLLACLDAELGPAAACTPWAGMSRTRHPVMPVRQRVRASTWTMLMSRKWRWQCDRLPPSLPWMTQVRCNRHMHCPQFSATPFRAECPSLSGHMLTLAVARAGHGRGDGDAGYYRVRRQPKPLAVAIHMQSAHHIHE